MNRSLVAAIGLKDLKKSVDGIPDFREARAAILRRAGDVAIDAISGERLGACGMRNYSGRTRVGGGLHTCAEGEDAKDGKGNEF